MLKESLATAINLSPMAIWMVVVLVYVVRGKWSVLHRRVLWWSAIALVAIGAFELIRLQTVYITFTFAGWLLLLAFIELWLRRRRSHPKN